MCLFLLFQESLKRYFQLFSCICSINALASQKEDELKKTPTKRYLYLIEIDILLSPLSQAGMSRSAAVVCGYLMQKQGLDKDKALQHIAACRPCIG